jgi:hypothetical protein
VADGIGYLARCRVGYLDLRITMGARLFFCELRGLGYYREGGLFFFLLYLTEQLCLLVYI